VAGWSQSAGMGVLGKFTAAYWPVEERGRLGIHTIGRTYCVQGSGGGGGRDWSLGWTQDLSHHLTLYFPPGRLVAASCKSVWCCTVLFLVGGGGRERRGGEGHRGWVGSVMLGNGVGSPQ